MTTVDVVVVSYNSSAHLRECVEPLCAIDSVRVIVVDNASSDGSLSTIADLDVRTVARRQNGGFATGCNEGWRAGDSPFVLFLNPDARVGEPSLRALCEPLESRPDVGAVGPRIHNDGDALEFSQRRFPSLARTYAQATFLHRLFPRASWADEVIRDRRAYESSGSPPWLSGACLLVRRSALESIGGWDESFVHYGEDKDLCRRLRRAGLAVVYEPGSLVHHTGGTSAPRVGLLPILAWSRVHYARKHSTKAVAMLHRIGVGLGCALRVVVSRGRAGSRRAQATALRHVITGRAPGLPVGGSD